MFISKKYRRIKNNIRNTCPNQKIVVPLPQKRVSPVRHAPSELPQGLTAARVLGCSGAMQIAYPPASLAQLARARDL